MKEKLNRHQQAAAQMKENILEAARNIFVKKGFSGTSIGEIAKQADIHQGLIYHYFENKEDLWRQVKVSYLEKVGQMEPLVGKEPPESLKELIDRMVRLRSRLYEKHPELFRMVLWQYLEGNEQQLSGLSDVWVERILEHIRLLQKKGLMTQTLTPSEVLMWLNAAVCAPLITSKKATKGSSQIGQKLADQLESWLS